MPPLLGDVFRARRSELGGSPLITYYDLGTGERTELSAVSLANWVDKTSNLLVDELLVEPSDPVELALAHEHPAHWVTFIWELACWQVGAVVTLDAPVKVPVRVVAPGESWDADPTTQVVVCSLHPLGLGLPEPPPQGALDYSLEVRRQGDRYARASVAPTVGAWWEWAARNGDAPTPIRRLSQADLVDRPTPQRRRSLIQPSTAWQGVVALLETVLSGGSLVVVAGPADEDVLRRIGDQERADL